MGVKEQMIEILRSSETSRIRFTYRHSSVTAVINSDVFRRVASGLASGHFHVVPGRHAENKITYSAWGDGDDAANTFYLGNNPRYSRDFNALVVHEAVHAYFDLARVTIPWADNESVAYIAQGYYLRNSGYPESRIEFGEPYRTGYFIANTLANGVDASTMIDDLRANLLGDSRYGHYITATFHGDG
ncbi:MAG TPA: hypothetical protein VK468_05700 [Pyrinomonadaceae bacterium]|nr:hypothetical protein [Pyrinomonadaceae bacterium]